MSTTTENLWEAGVISASTPDAAIEAQVERLQRRRAEHLAGRRTVRLRDIDAQIEALQRERRMVERQSAVDDGKEFIDIADVMINALRGELRRRAE